MNVPIKTLSPARFWTAISLFAIFLLACLAIAPIFGSVKIDIFRAFDFSIPLADNSDRFVLFTTRIPRVVLAMVVGASLALSGAAMQALLRNPLASPFTLGVASGGTLGAALALTTGIGATIFKVPGTVLGSFIFSLITVGLVWSLAWRRGRLPTGLLLLAGVSVNFLFGALVMLLHYFSDFTQSYALVRWMMGSLDTVGYDSVWGVAPFLLIAAIIFIVNARAFNLLALGDDAARAAGADVRRLGIMGFITSGLLAGAAVSQVGPIGFVGLIVPHAVRLLVGPDYRLVIPGSILAGGGFLVLCDLVSRTVMPPIDLPPGIITALLGAPFFLSLIKSSAREIAV